MSTAVDAFGRLDILVNNAALTVRGGSERLSPADYFAPFEDYKRRRLGPGAQRRTSPGMLLCAQAAGRQMLSQDPPGGVVVNISSTYGVVAPDQRLYDGVRSPYADTGFNTPVSYAVTKTAVLGLTRYLATYWGTAKTSASMRSRRTAFSTTTTLPSFATSCFDRRLVAWRATMSTAARCCSWYRMRPAT